MYWISIRISRKFGLLAGIEHRTMRSKFMTIFIKKIAKKNS